MKLYRYGSGPTENDFWTVRFGTHFYLASEVDAEIAKLKEALLWIASMADESDEWDGRDRFIEARAKAQAALKL